MKRKKNILITLFFFTILILIIKCYMDNVFIRPVNVKSQKNFGIIDGDLYAEHKNIKESLSSNNNAVSSEQHGDSIMNFLEDIAPDTSFYYYDAETDGKISSYHIIKGLEWMVDLNVDCVTISLSSKRYSQELENWILENADKIQIYASYNNSLNSFDYPAEYEGVIGIGTTDIFNSKDVDIIYKSNNIVVISLGVKRYCGNSYLAPYTMLKNN